MNILFMPPLYWRVSSDCELYCDARLQCDGTGKLRRENFPALFFQLSAENAAGLAE